MHLYLHFFYNFGIHKKYTIPFSISILCSLQLNEVCYKVSLTENFQRQCCRTLIPLSNGTQILGETLTLQPEL